MIISLEAVFALVAEMIWYKKVPGINELIGSGIMLSAIIISQIDFSRRKKHAK
ncbi:MAG: hypothetical protein IJV00_01725 [Clostridia bacterium]|nr:hypothetical protein [Clostridia bacterium]